MDFARGDGGQFWEPVFDVVSFWVLVFGLFDDVEEAKATGIVTYASSIVPVAPVATYVIVDE